MIICKSGALVHAVNNPEAFLSDTYLQGTAIAISMNLASDSDKFAYESTSSAFFLPVYRVTKVLGDKLSIQGPNGCYIGPESRVCHPVLRLLFRNVRT